MTIVVAGDRSGVGKTTVTIALLAALKKRGLSVQSFKVGPDYIDPMFHQRVTGRSCRNLDPVLTSESYVQRCFDRHTQDVSYAIVEGVMGLFDGAAGREDFASTAHVARLLNLPVLLVVDCSRMSHSIAALVHGYRSFDSRLVFAGIVLNRVGSDRHLELLKSALEPLQIPILGVLRRQTEITIPDRHLGLVPTTELGDLNTVVDQLGYIGETCFDWLQLLPLIQQSAPAQPKIQRLHPTARIAIARDAAFSFYYQDNLDLLERLGGELVFWSPLQDTKLPDVQGLYFGGGFPEMFAQQLSENQAARSAVRAAIQAGMPTYAECGGLMYLCQSLTDFTETSFPMVGILPTETRMSSRLTLGYRQAIAQQDTPLLTENQSVWGHEFHRSHLTTEPKNPLYTLTQNSKLKTQNSLEGWKIHQVHASYVHLHWGATPEIPQRFLQHCARFSAT